MNLSTEHYVNCGWCGSQINWADPAFVSYFSASGAIDPETGMLQVKVPAARKIVSLLVRPAETTAPGSSPQLVALCCSGDCQEQLSQAWAKPDPALALN